MADSAGEKTERATPKRLEEAFKKGQIARSMEVQTVFVLGSIASGIFVFRPGNLENTGQHHGRFARPLA